VKVGSFAMKHIPMLKWSANAGRCKILADRAETQLRGGSDQSGGQNRAASLL
jgi:hypothetical protein